MIPRLPIFILLALAVVIPAVGNTIVPTPWMVGRYEDRLQVIRRAGPADADALCSFLSFAQQGTEVTLEELATLKNEAGMILVQLPNPPEPLARRFLSLAADRNGDPMWRDYCVQFLGMGFQKWNATDRKAVAAYLVEVAKSDKGATGGTALIALWHNANAPEIGTNVVTTLALNALRDPNYGDGGRMTAIQVCAELGVKAALPEIRAVAAHSETLRASAIAALGALGDHSDLPQLRAWAGSSDRTVQLPALAALRRFEKKSAGKEKDSRQ